jgi:acetyl esterase/lipase
VAVSPARTATFSSRKLRKPGCSTETSNLPKADLLWPGAAPGAQGTQDIDQPTLAPYLVPQGRGTGTAVIVCPGGGYAHLSMDKEGDQVARWLNSLGVTAFVLKYRLGPKYHHPVELGDAQRAIRTVRSKAAEYRVLPDRIGIMGFSAGGHLASTAGTHFDAGDATRRGPHRPREQPSRFPGAVLPGGPSASSRIRARAQCCWATIPIPSWWRACRMNCR